jgi:SAM-dependent methyltransferase
MTGPTRFPCLSCLPGGPSCGESPLMNVSANQRKWEYPNRLYQWHLRRYLDRLYHWLCYTGARTILDVGCGEGYVCRAMRQRGYAGEWTGFDRNESAIEQARQLCPDATWSTADIYELPPADAAYDLALCAEVLEHLERPDQALAELVRVSRRWILVTVPLEPWFRSLTWLSLKTGLGGAPEHVNHWSGRAFRRFVSRAGGLHRWERSTIYQLGLIETKAPWTHTTEGVG